jgi:hypothetical protein
MPEKGLAREIVVGVIVAVVVAAGGVLWNWATAGGLIRALGGITAEDVAKIVKPGPPALQVRRVHRDQR